jgi:hypothetical protein
MEQPLVLHDTPEPAPDASDRERLEQALLEDVKRHAEEVILRLLALLRTDPIRALLLIERYSNISVRFIAELQGAYQKEPKRCDNIHFEQGNGNFLANAATGTLITTAGTGNMIGMTPTISLNQTPGEPDIRILTGAMRDARAMGDATLEQSLRERLDRVIGVHPDPGTPTCAEEPPTTRAEIEAATQTARIVEIAT